MGKEDGGLSKMDHPNLTDLLGVNSEMPYGPDAFVNGAFQVKDYVKVAFDLLIGVDSKVIVNKHYSEKDFICIDGILIKVLDKSTFKKIYDTKSKKEYNAHILGFASSFRSDFWKYGGEAYILEGDLFKVMKIIGHEIGHLMERPMLNPVVEEAKAYAFEKAWGRVIGENDIAGLSKTNIAQLIPPNDEVHYSAVRFVNEKVESGYEPLELFYKIGELGVLPDM